MKKLPNNSNQKEKNPNFIFTITAILYVCFFTGAVFLVYQDKINYDQFIVFFLSLNFLSTGFTKTINYIIGD